MSPIRAFALTAGGFVAALAGCGYLYQRVGLRRDRSRYRAPGRIIRTGECALHLHEQGAGEPTVVLEAGVAGTSLGWAIVQPCIAEFTSVCSYDRAGLGWSAAARKPRAVAQMVSELRGVLLAAGRPGPYVLVGHSFGGLLVRAFAAQFPKLTAGILLLDPVSVSAWSNCSALDRRRLARGVALSRRGALLARFGVVRAVLTLLTSGSRVVPKVVGRTAAGNGAPTMERLVGQVRKLPKEVWPIIQAHWSDEKCFRAMAEYLDALPRCSDEAQTLTPPRGVPLMILSAETATHAELQERDEWVRQSAQGEHVILKGTGHWIQLEQPDAVVTALRTLVKANSRQTVI